MDPGPGQGEKLWWKNLNKTYIFYDKFSNLYDLQLCKSMSSFLRNKLKYLRKKGRSQSNVSHSSEKKTVHVTEKDKM